MSYMYVLHVCLTCILETMHVGVLFWLQQPYKRSPIVTIGDRLSQMLSPKWMLTLV